MQTQFISESLKTPVRGEYDVIVAGGGTAGVVAAIAAARTGAKTLLIERGSYLGGTVLNGAGPLHSFFNSYKAFGVEKVQLVRGIPDEIIRRMTERDGCLGHLEQELGSDYDSVATIIDWEIFKDVMFDMMREAGVKLLLHTLIVGSIVEEGALKGLLIESKSGREAVLARQIVDCTGDADVAFHAGVDCPNVTADPRTHVGMPFGMAGVDIPKVCEYMREKGVLFSMIHADKGDDHDNIVRTGFRLADLPEFSEYMKKTRMWGPLCVARKPGDFSFINTANLEPVDGVNVEALTDAEVDLRKQVMNISEMLKKYVPGFEKSYVYWTPNTVGVRRTRIVRCAYDITLEDITEAHRFDDEIALYGFHDLAPRYTIKNGGWYGIPYRALLPEGVENLLVAGRMITSDWTAHMSTRNTVSCMAQGQAAGTAAAMCALNDTTPRRLDVPALRAQLRKDGVYLG